MEAAMSDQPSDVEALREDARERIEDMPAETALGHRDPAGGGEGDPKEYEGDNNATS
jgi:hypothetical protein